MLTNMPTVFFYPLLIIWSLIYGAIGGAFFNILAVYENWVEVNRFHILLWKKYPQRSYRKYIANIWTNQIRNRPVELAEYTKTQVERRFPAEPFPVIRIMTNTLFMLFLIPFMVCLGMLKGPLYVYQKSLHKRAIQQ